MNRLQKISWSLVISMSLALLLGVAAAVVHYLGVGSPRPFVYSAFGIIGIGVFLVFRFRPDKGAVKCDERDKLIERNASLAGFGAVYLLVILVSIIPPMIDQKARIPTTWFPFLLVSAVFCQVFAQSLAILVQYGWKGKDNE